jgi:hypothetical protein
LIDVPRGKETAINELHCRGGFGHWGKLFNWKKGEMGDKEKCGNDPFRVVSFCFMRLILSFP